MEPTILAQQSTAVLSRTREIFDDAPEGETPYQILQHAFYGVTDALLNITQVNGRLVVDISRQPTRSERWKSKAGLFALTTIDWLSQANHNLYGTNKPGLIGGSMTGIASVMGVPMLHKIDFFNNPLHALVVDIPQQEGVFPCDAARNAAISLCSNGVEGGQIGQCSDDPANPGRFQVNFYTDDGEIKVTNMTLAGAVTSMQETTCSAVVGGSAPLQEVPVSPTEAEVLQPVPATQVVEPVQNLNDPIVDCVGTMSSDTNGVVSEMLSISTGRSEANPSGDINILKTSIQAACGVVIDDATASLFLQETTAPWIVDNYPIGATEFESWLSQHLAKDSTSEPAPAVVPTNKMESVTATPDRNCDEPVRIEIPIELIGDEALAFFRNEVLNQCGVELTDLEAEAIMQSRNENLPENVQVVSENYLQEIKSHKIDIEDYSPGERYSAIGRYLAFVAGLSLVGTTLYMFLKRYRMSDIFPAITEE